MISLQSKAILASMAFLPHFSGAVHGAVQTVPVSGYCLDFGSALTSTDSTMSLSVVLSEEEPVRGFQFEIVDNTGDALVLRSVDTGEKIASWQVPAVETPGGDVRILGFGLSGEETTPGGPGLLLEITFDIVGPLEEAVAFHFGGQGGVHLVTGTVQSLACGFPDEDAPRVFPVDWLAVGAGGVDLPLVFSMESNYPNPFNAATVIGYRVPEAAHVGLTVYNLLGQKVATLVSGRTGPGYHRVHWDGRNDRGQPVSSGVYLVVFRASGVVQKGKMVLLR